MCKKSLHVLTWLQYQIGWPDRIKDNLCNVCLNGSGFLNPDHLLLHTDYNKWGKITCKNFFSSSGTDNEKRGQAQTRLVLLRCMKV